ncbi:hypothetical protein BBJ28_00003561 [Nothophytophthora sp. Chile5]|nr:hypothetical protein BBJ28_00003561 [Nothophytophthora sp. Chile5]
MESRTSATGITRPAPQSKSKPRKRANYLRHSKRCAIIKRVSNGEQQAALAREYGVTRAAVSHIYKNRVEILARSSDEESDDGNAVELAGAHNEVFLIRHDAVLVLLTSIQNVTTEPTALDRAISRLIMYVKYVRNDALQLLAHPLWLTFVRILIEEAIALLGTQAVQRALRILGVKETSISIVVIQSTAAGIAVIRKQFPGSMGI